MVSAWRNFKNIFSRPLFTIIFRPDMLKFHPYSILTGDTMVGFVIFCVLTRIKLARSSKDKWDHFDKLLFLGLCREFRHQFFILINVIEFQIPNIYRNLKGREEESNHSSLFHKACKKMKKSAVLCTLAWPHFFSWAELSSGMNKVGLSSNLVCIKFQGFWFFLIFNVTNWAPL